MAKQAKKTQTDYTRGGRDISNTAIPLYQQSLNQLGNYMDNVQNRLDPYLENYVNLGQAAQQSDFLRNYQRAMGQATAGNYAATTGGYSSLNQQGYDDQQRYYNDLAARMYSQGLSQASDLANQEFNMLYNVPGVYNTAYQQGKAYSDIQQYNDMVDQMNDNWWAPALQTVGQIGGAVAGAAVGNPVLGAQIGGGIMGAMGNQFTIDPSSLRSVGGATPTEFEQRQGLYNNVFNQQNVAQGLSGLFGQSSNKQNRNASNINTPNTSATFTGSSGNYDRLKR
ncbi:MAG: hypothetical protein NC218_08355 [Acetobacter sp.]|nr:hypothetical protein [Acetobacter sp.]